MSQSKHVYLFLVLTTVWLLAEAALFAGSSHDHAIAAEAVVAPGTIVARDCRNERCEVTVSYTDQSGVTRHSKHGLNYKYAQKVRRGDSIQVWYRRSNPVEFMLPETDAGIAYDPKLSLLCATMILSATAASFFLERHNARKAHEIATLLGDDATARDHMIGELKRLDVVESVNEPNRHRSQANKTEPNDILAKLGEMARNGGKRDMDRLKREQRERPLSRQDALNPDYHGG